MPLATSVSLVSMEPIFDDLVCDAKHWEDCDDLVSHKPSGGQKSNFSSVNDGINELLDDSRRKKTDGWHLGHSSAEMPDMIHRSILHRKDDGISDIANLDHMQYLQKLIDDEGLLEELGITSFGTESTESGSEGSDDDISIISLGEDYHTMHSEVLRTTLLVVRECPRATTEAWSSSSGIISQQSTRTFADSRTTTSSTGRCTVDVGIRTQSPHRSAVNEPPLRRTIQNIAAAEPGRPRSGTAYPSGGGTSLSGSAEEAYPLAGAAAVALRSIRGQRADRADEEEEEEARAGTPARPWGHTEEA